MIAGPSFNGVPILQSAQNLDMRFRRRKSLSSTKLRLPKVNAKETTSSTVIVAFEFSDEIIEIPGLSEVFERFANVHPRIPVPSKF